MKGGTVKASDVVPMILHHLKIPIYKRPPKPKEVDPDAPADGDDAKVDEPPVVETKKKPKTKKEKEKEEEEKRRLAAIAEEEECNYPIVHQ